MIEITNDLFDIAWRLRSIHDSYRLYYNTDKSRYEVHNYNTGALEFIVPYDELDARTVEYALYTGVQNAAALLEEMERNNAMVEKHQINDMIESAVCCIEKGEIYENK